MVIGSLDTQMYPVLGAICNSVMFTGRIILDIKPGFRMSERKCLLRNENDVPAYCLLHSD